MQTKVFDCRKCWNYKTKNGKYFCGKRNWSGLKFPEPLEQRHMKLLEKVVLECDDYDPIGGE